MRRIRLLPERSYQDVAQSPPPDIDIGSGFPRTTRSSARSAVACQTCMTGAKPTRFVQCVQPSHLPNGPCASWLTSGPCVGSASTASRTGPIGSLIAPPYDVAAEPAIGAQFSIRKIESVDLGSTGGDHALAARRYRDWLEQGVLRRDAAPMLYVHRHQFDQRRRRRSREPGCWPGCA